MNDFKKERQLLQLLNELATEDNCLTVYIQQIELAIKEIEDFYKYLANIANLME